MLLKKVLKVDVWREEVEVIKEGAIQFFQASLDDVNAGRMELAALHAQQSVQLGLKYILASHTGHYPYTHDLKTLFREASTIKLKLARFLDSKLEIIELLEDAYLGARYLLKSSYERLSYGEVEDTYR